MRVSHRLIVGVVAFAASAFAGRAHGECSLLSDLQQAEAVHKTVAAAASKATISSALEWKIALLVGPKFLTNPSVGWIDALQTLQPALTAGEWAELGAYLAADAAYAASEASLTAAQDAYTQAANRSAEALRQAEAAYAEEVKFLDAERAAIAGMPVDDGAYLDRAAKLAERLKAAYAKMNADLAPFVDCFAGPRSFVEDKNKRLKKIAALEAEIARRRGAKSGAAAAVAGAVAIPPAPGPLGDAWTLVDVRVSKFGGAVKRADATGYAIEVPQDDGTTAKSSVEFVKVPPAEMRVNQVVRLEAKAGGDPRAYITFGMWTEQVRRGAIESDNACANVANFKSTGTPGVATETFFFAPDDRNAEIVVQFHGGKYNGDDVKIQWVYRRK